MTDTEARKPAGMRRSTRIILFASLALNLLVLGLVVGAAVSHRFGNGHPARVDRPGGALTVALSPQDRRAIGRALWKERIARTDKLVEYQAIIAALTADPYQPEALRLALHTRFETLHGGAERGRDLLLERLEGMTDAERADYAKRLQGILERGAKNRRDKRRDGPPDY